MMMMIYSFSMRDGLETSRYHWSGIVINFPHITRIENNKVLNLRLKKEINIVSGL